MSLTVKKTTPTSVRFNSDVLEYLKQVSEDLGISVSTYIQDIVIERLEDDYDIKLADERISEWNKNGKKTYSHEEMMKRYG